MEHLLFVGDIGVGANFVKNICFTDPTYNAPFNVKYLESIYNHIDQDKIHRSWLSRESRTRTWDTKFGIDLSNHIPADTSTVLCSTPKTIFINHSSFYDNNDRVKLVELSNRSTVILLIPQSLKAFHWQIRAYVLKKGLDNMHNFAFSDNVEENKKSYIEKHGIDLYNKCNIFNMYEFCRARWQAMREFFETNNLPILYTDNLYKGNLESFLESLQNIKHIDIDLSVSRTLYNDWLKFHWPFDETDDWEFSYSRCKP